MWKLVICSLFVFSAQAQHKSSGGSSDGGGNSVDHAMVEEFRVEDISSLHGYTAFSAKLEELRAQFPQFAKRIDQARKLKVWYLIPRKFKELPEEQTGLRFASEQVAYQNDREVFVSEVDLKNMNESSAGVKIMHELMMALQPHRDVTRVRIANGVIFSRSSTTNAIQDALATNGFGVYFTREQGQLIRRAAQEEYVHFLGSVLTGAGALCRLGANGITDVKGKRGSAVSASLNLLRLRLVADSWLENPNDKSWISVITTYKGVKSDDSSPENSNNSYYSFYSYYSPFRPNNFDSGILSSHANLRSQFKSALQSACLRYPSRFGKKACDEFPAVLKKYDDSTRDRHDPAESISAMSALLGFAEPNLKDLGRIRRYLAETNPALPRIMAMTAMSLESLNFSYSDLSYHPAYEDAKVVYQMARSEFPYYGNLKPQARFDALCTNVVSLKTSVDGLYNKMTGISKTPAPSTTISESEILELPK